MSEDEIAIRDLVNRWMSATQTGDAATVLDLMTDDVLFTVAGREPFGKEAFAAASKGMEGQGLRIEGSNEIRELKLLGNGWAYIRNYIDITMTPPGGQPVRRAGYTLTILKKCEDGRWRLTRDANLLTEQK
jgi:uncharacterized protein (TIGR02246 family)